MTKKKLIYIGGYGRSGSTLLDAYLSSSPEVFGVGEAANFFSDLINRKKCACGKLVSDCDCWGELVNRYIEDGFDILRLDQITRISEKMLARPSNDEAKCYKECWQIFWDHVFKKYQYVVDSSKTTRWTAQRPSCTVKLDMDVIFIYLYRQPRSLLASLSKGSNKSLQAGILRKEPPIFLIRSLMGWIVGNVYAVLASRNSSASTILIDYDVFCEKPEAIFSVLRDLDVFCQAPTSIRPGHGISGNRIRSRLKKIEKQSLAEPRLGLLSRALAAVMSVLLPVFLRLAGPSIRL